MKDRIQSLLISAVLFLGMYFIGTGFTWAGDSQPFLTEDPPPVKIVLTQSTPEETQTQTEAKTSAKVTLEEVVVSAEKQPKSGSAEAGYRVDSVSIGPLGNANPLNTPYQINTVSSDLMKNVQAKTLKEVTKYMPSTQIEERGGPDVGRPQTRGFEGTVSENNRMDGMNIAVTTAYPMEQFEQIEVLNGLAGSLYGPANPSGVYNFVLKRPTVTPLYEMNMSYGPDNITTVHTDLGGPLGNKFGYRLNLLYGSGEGYADESELDRTLGSLSIDWHISDATVAELNYSYYNFNKEGYPGGFSYASTIQLPDAFDPTDAGYGQEWAGSDLTTNTASLRVKHDFNKDWHLVAGFLDQVANRDMHSVTNTFTDNAGNYSTTFRPSSSAWEVDSLLLYLNGHMETGSITHDLSLGTNGHERRMMSAETSMGNITIGTASIYNPVSYEEPSWWTDADRYKASRLRQQAVTMGDTITFNESWSIMLSASYNWYSVHNYNVAHETTKKYDKSGISSAASVMFKPAENITTYVTYADSLQQGDTAPTTADNANEILEPYRSEQWESGVKVELNKLNLSTAVFRIERPFAYTGTDNIFEEQGNQVNYGLELMATGKIIDSVTIYTGATFMNPKLKDTVNDNTSNQQVVGVPKRQANLLLEYQVPFIRGLTPYVNFHYTGRRPANDTNTSWADDYTTIDLGARYATKLMGKDTTFRFMVNNLTDEEYWSSIFPGSTNGTGGSCSAFLGSPREVVASVQFVF